MNDDLLMAIDAGTGSVRAVIFDLNGNQLSCHQEEWAHRENPLYPGSMDFDWKKNWDLTKTCIKNSISKANINANSIIGISTTCMREGFVLYNENKDEIWACANVDSRASEEVKNLIEKDANLEKQLYSLTGQSFALDSIPRLLWIKKRCPDIYNSSKYFSMINDWLIYKLTGELYSEPSNGSTTGLLNIKTREFEKHIYKDFEIKEDLIPKTLESGSIAGKVCPEASKECGLSTDTSVVIGGGDAQLGCIGVGSVKEGEAALFGGSFWQLEYNTKNVTMDPLCRIRINCHALKDMLQYEAIAFQPGLVMRWYRDGFCQLEKEQEKAQNKSVYEIMNDKCSNVPPGSFGVLCTFSDIMNLTCWKHASPTITNFGLDSDLFNKYTFYRAILENAAYVSRGHKELIEELTGKQITSITFASGAAKSPLWCQIVSDVLNVEVKVPVVKEATALGCAIIAGYGLGKYESIEKASKDMIKYEKSYTPIKENVEVYNEIFTNWKKVYAAQLELVNKRITKPMWAAPGLI